MNSKKSLEDLIRDNRKEFDDLRAPAHVWNRIVSQPVKVHPMWKWSAIAASALLLLSVGFIIGFKTQSGPGIKGWDEYAETEKYYESRINVKMEQIKTLDVSNEVLNDLQVLDDVYHELKTQLLQDPNADAEVLLSTMIRHHQQKLEVMEEILNRVDKYKNNVDENLEM